MKIKVLLGMSGGVDSSVSAVLLQKAGYEVIGGFMKNWSEETANFSSECSWKTERRDALSVAEQLGIEFHTFDFEIEYRKLVYEYMIAEYKAGRTPNPDILCNKYLKFDLFMREAEKLNCSFVATGHYARIHHDANGTAHLLSGIDQIKDQSYFLCQLSQEQLQKIIFPIGDLQKKKVREIALQHKLSTAQKKDSQGICFVGKVEMKDFLSARIQPHSGDIITTDGQLIGKHDGFEFYTIGQRSGLGVGGGTPYYVVERRSSTNEIIVALGEDDPALFRLELTATNLTETITGILDRSVGETIAARIRYRQPLAPCQIRLLDDFRSLVVTFNTPQRAIASGQFIAFYIGEELIGSGVIN